MDSSVARAMTAEDEVGGCERGAATVDTLAPQAGSGGGNFDGRCPLSGAASGASAEDGVPADIKVFRRCEAGTISPVPSSVANGDLGATLRCDAGACADVDAGATERGAGVRERGAGVRERGAGVTECGAGVTERGAGVTERGAGATEYGAGATERGAGATERGAGVTERGAGVANGNPLREDGGALTLGGDAGKLTLGNVELRVGTGRF